MSGSLSAECVEDHEPDSCDPTRPTTLVAGGGGMGAVGADHARHSRDCLAGSPVTPGRPIRTGPAHPQRVRWPRAGGGERATVGAVLASGRPRHPVGWLLLVLGLSLTRGLAPGIPLRAGGPARRPAGRRRRSPVLAITVLTSRPRAPVLSCCSPPPGRCPRPAGAGGPGSAAAAIVLLVGLSVVQRTAGPPVSRLGRPFDRSGQVASAGRQPAGLSVRHPGRGRRGRLAGGALPPRPRDRAPAAALGGLGGRAGRGGAVVALPAFR